VHLDAATDENLLHQVAESWFSSVMFHASALGYADNVAATGIETLAVGVGGSQAMVGRTPRRHHLAPELGIGQRPVQAELQSASLEGRAWPRARVGPSRSRPQVLASTAPGTLHL
jgi:hypothetical protein